MVFVVGVKFLSFWGVVREVREVKEVREVREIKEVREVKEKKYLSSGVFRYNYCSGQRGLLPKSRAKHTNTQKHAQTGCVPMCAMCILCAPKPHKINFVHTQSHPRP